MICIFNDDLNCILLFRSCFFPFNSLISKVIGKALKFKNIFYNLRLMVMDNSLKNQKNDSTAVSK